MKINSRLLPTARARQEDSRQPRPEDLAKICEALNREDARYILIGGFAVIARGLERPTKDIGLLIDASPDIDRIKRALAILPDNAVRQVRSDEIDRYDIIRVADEVVVNLMLDRLTHRHSRLGRVWTRARQEVALGTCRMLFRTCAG